MQDNGEIESSQSVKLYKASMVLSGEIPEGNEIDISTNSEVLSSTFLILIFPFSFAFKIELINEVVVVLKGISVICNVFLSICEILALTLTFPPLFPSL